MTSTSDRWLTPTDLRDAAVDALSDHLSGYDPSDPDAFAGASVVAERPADSNGQGPGIRVHCPITNQTFRLYVYMET